MNIKLKLFFYLILMSVSGLSFGADVTPPQLESWELSPASINVDDGPAVVTAIFRLTDETGVDDFKVNVSARHDGSGQNSGFSSVNLISGDYNDGVWQADLPIAANSAPGEWIVSLFPLTDILGNSSSFFGPGSGYTNTFEVETNKIPDVTPPQLESWELSPASINVDDGPAVVTAIFRLTDETGVDDFKVNVSARHDGSGQNSGFSSVNLISGDYNDGVWQADLPIAANSAPGEWIVSLFPLTDILGNSSSFFGPGSGYTNTFEVETNKIPDVTPPQLESWELSPASINVDDGPAVVTAIFRLTDETGVDDFKVNVSARHDGSGQNSGFSSVNLISGDYNDGVWQADLPIAANSAPGEWIVSLFPLTDILGNSSSFFGPGSGYVSSFTNYTDSDRDGMPDAWEIRYGLDPNDASDATSDQDNDGVSALDEFLAGTIPSGSLDIDGNEKYDALTDGLLLLRGMFGLDGSALVTGTIASDAAYIESADIESRIATLGDLADIDGNGEIDALTDGLLTLRYLFGLQGDTLINGVVADDATRTSAEEIEAHLETLMPTL